MRHALARCEDLTRFLNDGRIEIDSNTAERSIHPIALSRGNAQFAGSDSGDVNWVVIASLIECCKLNSYAYLADVLAKIVYGQSNSAIDKLLLWARTGPRRLKDVT